MALPNSDDVKSLDYIYEGQPLSRLSPDQEVDTETLDYLYEAQPLVTQAGITAISLDEETPVLDELSTYFPGGQDYTPVLDSLITNRNYNVTFEEFIPILDTVLGPERIDIEVLGSVELRVLRAIEFNGTVKIGVLGAVDLTGTVNNNVLSDNLVAVTNATSLSNPTQTTVILGGTTVQSFPATLPPTGLSNARCYINYLCNSLFSDQSLGNFFSWQLSQDNWRTVSIADFDSMGDEIEIFGLKGTITSKGREKTGSSYGYINGGIMGTPRLNKPIAFLYNNGQNPYTTIIPDQSLTVPDATNWKTYADAARKIASVAGVNINWTIQDYPLTDLSFQSGQTGQESLNSLAESVGAKLRWNGDVDYTVLYPNKPIGTYQVIDCCFIQALSETCNLDIKTGIYNPGVYAFPQYNTQNVGSAQLPMDQPEVDPQPNGSFSRNVEVLYTSSKLETQSDPGFLLDLPFDFEDVFIKIITVNDGTGQFVTLNPTRWFLLQTGFSGEYINYNDVAGVLQPQIRINWELFPQANTDVQNGNFKFIIGFSRKSLSGAGRQANSSQNEIDKQTQARTWQRFRFIPTCQYNVTAIFTGAIPLKGMALKAAIGDFSIGENNDVIIEDWSFSNPGILNITGIKWSQISYYDYMLEQQ